MRLTKEQLRHIKEVFRDVYSEGELYLFGSRVDESKKGGDIDLYISVKDKDNLVYKKIHFLAKLKRKIGEQKIDVVYDIGKERVIDKIVKNEGILL